MPKDKDATRTVFEAWEEGEMLRLVLRDRVTIDPAVMKDILRCLDLLDPRGLHPVMVEMEDLVRMSSEARLLLVRACRNGHRPVAYMAHDLPERIQGEFFLRHHQPPFPFRVFGFREEAEHWILGQRAMMAFSMS